jgi:CheY-like chemotaxis protein
MADSGPMITNARIALVEDDQDLRQSTLEYLTLAGFSVWGAGSAEAFYRQFAADPVDVVVLDIGLPGEDGLGVAAMLKANPHVAIIILSARDGLDDRLLGLRAGADRYLVTLSQVALNDSIMVIAFAPLVGLLLGMSAIIVPWDNGWRVRLCWRD